MSQAHWCHHVDTEHVLDIGWRLIECGGSAHVARVVHEGINRPKRSTARMTTVSAAESSRRSVATTGDGLAILPATLWSLSSRQALKTTLAPATPRRAIPGPGMATK